MRQNNYFFKGGKSYTSDSNLQSLVVDWLRFPLAMAVVAIHSFGTPIDLAALHANPISAQAVYDFVRIAVSQVGTRFAVPAFFMFSGYLFFINVRKWNLETYKTKLQKRFKSLFIPYIIWIVLDIMYGRGIRFLFKGETLENAWEYVSENGLHLFWDSQVWATHITNLLGINMPNSGPILIPLWFVRDLMVVTLLTPLVYILIRKFKFVPVIVLGVCFLFQVWLSVPGFSITCFFWFFTGAYFGIEKKDMVSKLYAFRIPAYCICIATMLPLVWYNGRTSDGVTTNLVIQFIYQLFVMSAVVSVTSIAARLVKKGKVKVYPVLAKASFFIFLIHPFVLGPIFKVTGLLIPKGSYFLMTIAFLATPCIATIVCLFIFQLMDKWVPKLLFVLTGSRALHQH